MPLFQRIRGYNKVFTPPEAWDEETQGPCATVYVRQVIINGVFFNLMALEFTPEERAKMDAGEPVILGISGLVLPVMFMNVGDIE